MWWTGRRAGSAGTCHLRAPSRLPLLGADGYAAMWRDRAGLARRHRVSVGVAEHLLERYGTLAPEVLRLAGRHPDLTGPVAGAPEYLAAEVAYAARAEGALHLADVLARRTRIAVETPHRGTESARHVAPSRRRAGLVGGDGGAGGGALPRDGGGGAGVAADA